MDTDEKKEVERKKFTFVLHRFDISMGLLDGGVLCVALEPRREFRTRDTDMGTLFNPVFCFLFLFFGDFLLLLFV